MERDKLLRKDTETHCAYSPGAVTSKDREGEMERERDGDTPHSPQRHSPETHALTRHGPNTGLTT